MTNAAQIQVTDGVLHAAIRAAILAPSLHNSQPWRFRLVPAGLEIHADPDRQLPVADPTGWAVRIACGSAAANAQLSLAVAGIHADLRLRPDARRPELLALVAPSHPTPPTPRELALHAAITRRHSNRRPFADVRVPADACAALRAAAVDAGAWLVDS